MTARESFASRRPCDISGTAERNPHGGAMSSDAEKPEKRGYRTRNFTVKRTGKQDEEGQTRQVRGNGGVTFYHSRL